MIFIISLSCLSSVSADDLDDAGLEEDSIQMDPVQEAPISQDPIAESDDAIALAADEEAIQEPLEDDSDILISNEKPKSNALSSANLELDNDADSENVQVGDFVTWILEAKNFGPELGKNVKVFDQLPEGMKFINYTATKGTFDSKTGIWDIGDLEVDQIETLSILTKALTPGEKINKANLTSDTNISNPDECYEEEEIDVLEKMDYSKKIIYSNQLPCVGNPVLMLVLSLMSLLIINIKRD